MALRESSDEKYPRTLILSPDLEPSTPTESRHTTCLLGGKSPSVKLMSRRENKELAKTNLKYMDRTMQELQHIGSIKDPECVKDFPAVLINKRGRAIFFKFPFR